MMCLHIPVHETAAKLYKRCARVSARLSRWSSVELRRPSVKPPLDLIQRQMIAYIGSVIGNIDHPILANQEIRRDPVGGPFHAARKHAGFHRTGCIQQNGRRQHRSPPLLYAVAAIQLHAWVCNDRKWCILTPNMELY